MRTRIKLRRISKWDPFYMLFSNYQWYRKLFGGEWERTYIEVTGTLEWVPIEYPVNPKASWNPKVFGSDETSSVFGWESWP